MLFDTYTVLTQRFPPGCQSLYGEEIGVETGLWLAIDAQFFPSILFSSNPSDERSDIELRFIGVQFSRDCQITFDSSKTVAGNFTIVRLSENDPDLVRVFLRLLDETFCVDGHPRNNRDIGEKILELADLFSRIENSEKDIVGLWGELIIIAQAVSLEMAARSWCLHKKAKYDFVSDSFALEVKTTLKPSREHRFSFEQLRPNGKLAVSVASVQVVRTHGGKAVYELMDHILNEIKDAGMRKAFFNLCLIKGGEDIYKSVLRLQLLSDQDGIACYAAVDIPVPSIDPELPISNVKFDVCLDGIPRQDDLASQKVLGFTNGGCTHD